MRVLHDGPLHYTSVDVLATDLSYLAISHHSTAGRCPNRSDSVQFSFELKVKKDTLRKSIDFTFKGGVNPRLIYGRQ